MNYYLRLGIVVFFFLLSVVVVLFVFAEIMIFVVVAIRVENMSFERFHAALGLFETWYFIGKMVVGGFLSLYVFKVLWDKCFSDDWKMVVARVMDGEYASTIVEIKKVP